MRISTATDGLEVLEGEGFLETLGDGARLEVDPLHACRLDLKGDRAVSLWERVYCFLLVSKWRPGNMRLHKLSLKISYC